MWQHSFQDRQIHQHFKYAIQRQELTTSYQVPSLTWVMMQTRRRITVWVIMLSFHPYPSFHVFRVLLLIKPVPCFVPASILKGLVCHVFIWLVLQDYVMTHLFDSHTSKFAGFTHHDVAVHWWSSYMYYAYQSSTPLHIIKKHPLLAMNPIKGPKMRCNVPQFLEIYDAPKICLQ